MAVYLIHARIINPETNEEESWHYTGWVKGLIGERIEDHRKTMCYPPAEGETKWRREGPGAKLVGVWNYRQVQWEVVRTWPGEDEEFERWLKGWHGASVFCPECSGDKAFNRARSKPSRGWDLDKLFTKLFG
jgi:hypothetical protein